MAKPVLVVVDDEDASLQALTRELESRYGAHYQVVSETSAAVALARLEKLRAAGASVPLVLADQWMPGISGPELLARVKGIFPTAQRGLMTSWGDRSADAPILEAAALGWMEFYLAKPAWSPDERFHRIVTGALEEWWREQGGRFEAVTVVGDGLRTALLEREAFGGQAGTSSRIRNYLGFPSGISGVELAQRASEQAWMFGTHFIYGNPATSLTRDRGLHIVGLQDRSQVRARAVVIASGMSYRRLGVPDLESLVGAGVFYGAGTIEAQAVAGKPVFVVGGGNSAGQAALHLSKHARQVTILVRSQSLAMSMSEYLIREIESAPNVNVRYRSEVTAGGGSGHLEHLLLRDRDSGEEEPVPAAGLFVLIGAEPFTGWLPDMVDRDRWGFILTGPDTGRRWPLKRAPFLLETTSPGVFAVGDVRNGSVRRVASAVGEGSIAIRLVHEYFALAPTAREGS